MTAPDRRELVEFVNEHDSFEELVEKVNTDRRSRKLLTDVETLGFEINEIIETEVEFFGAQELGWLWLIWEDVYDGEPAAQEATA